jgi:hypothetical protein
MAEQFPDRAAAERAALILCATHDAPAIVEILPDAFSSDSAKQFWAVSDEADLSSVPGLVVGLTVL